MYNNLNILLLANARRRMYLDVSFLKALVQLFKGTDATSINVSHSCNSVVN